MSDLENRADFFEILLALAILKYGENNTIIIPDSILDDFSGIPFSIDSSVDYTNRCTIHKLTFHPEESNKKLWQ